MVCAFEYRRADYLRAQALERLFHGRDRACASTVSRSNHRPNWEFDDLLEVGLMRDVGDRDDGGEAVG